MGTTEEPTPETWRVYGYYPGFPSSSPTVWTVSRPTPPPPVSYMRTRPPYSHRTAMSLQTPPRPSCPRVRTHDIVYRRFGIRTSPFQTQIAILMGMYTSSLLHFVALPFPTPVAAAPCFQMVLRTSQPYSNNTPRVFYTTQHLEHFLKDPELTV